MIEEAARLGAVALSRRRRIRKIRDRRWATRIEGTKWEVCESDA
jgi:hypothetical protein